MRLSPRDPEMPNRLINLGMAEVGLGHFDAAVVEFQKAINSGAHYFIPYVSLAAAYALAGKMDEAKAALAEAKRLNSELTVKWLTGHAPNISRPCSTACARRGCRRNEASLKAACGSGCDARRLSTGGSIRVGGALCRPQRGPATSPCGKVTRSPTTSRMAGRAVPKCGNFPSRPSGLLTSAERRRLSVPRNVPEAANRGKADQLSHCWRRPCPRRCAEPRSDRARARPLGQWRACPGVGQDRLLRAE